VHTDQYFDNIEPSVPTQLSRTIEVSQIIPASTPIHFPYEAPQIFIQPKDHRRVRMLNDLGKKCCPYVQADEGNVQQAYPEIRVTVHILVFMLE